MKVNQAVKAIWLLSIEFFELPWRYNSIRVGMDGKAFLCFKLRTMSIDADKAKPASTLYFKTSADPRIMRSRCWMRRVGLDEIPQLINIAKGDMRLFGSRPLVLSDWQLLTHAQQCRRSRLKPGCLGPYAMLRDRSNKDNLLKANDAYLRLEYRKRNQGRLALYSYYTSVAWLTFLAVLQGKVK